MVPAVLLLLLLRMAVAVASAVPALGARQSFQAMIAREVTADGLGLLVLTLLLFDAACAVAGGVLLLVLLSMLRSPLVLMPPLLLPLPSMSEAL